MKYIINDTNIWIDLKYADLLDKVFCLPYKIACPDILFYDELAKEEGDILIELGLEVLEMSSDEISEVEIVSNENRNISFNDSTALILAKARNYLLITGDMALRKVADKKKIECKGSLWLIDELVENSVISLEDAISCCEKLKKSGRRLPKNELDKRIEKWSKKSV